jgi:REP element-mobilizing transposase RayT
MGNTYSQIFIHLIFSTKHRTPSIKKEFEEELKSFIVKASKDHELEVLAVGGMPNHLHALLAMPPKFPVSKAAQIIKGSSSRWLNKHFFEKETFRWQRGYGAFSINKSLVPATTKYIQHQEGYHAEYTYQDEFTAILEKHEMDYKEKKLFT